MSIHPSRQPLIRISKNGEMRLKNKVSVAILKENAYEERALGSQLMTLKKHKARQDKYMTYRQLDFASKQIAASEERPVTIASFDTRHQSGLPPIQRLEARRRTTTMFTNGDFEKVKEPDPNRKTQGNWEKAVTMVRMAAQNRRENNNYADKKEKTFITHQHDEYEEGMTLPPLSFSGAEKLGEKPTRTARKGPKISRRLTFPEMIKLSREKSMVGLQDPRFLKLESCLGGQQNVKSARSRLITTLTVDSEAATDSLPKRFLKTS